MDELTCKSRVYEDRDPVLIINGEVFSQQVIDNKSIEPDSIKSVEVFKCTEEYLIEYGPRAAIAVVFIETSEEL